MNISKIIEELENLKLIYGDVEPRIYADGVQWGEVRSIEYEDGHIWINAKW
jgi:hypothetical protein